MDKEKRDSIVSQLYITIKNYDDLREIRMVLNNISKVLEQPEKSSLKVDDIVETKNRFIANGKIVEIIDKKARVKQKKFIYIIPLKMLYLKEENRKKEKQK